MLKGVLEYIRGQNFFMLCCIVIIISFVASPFLMSLGMIALFIGALFKNELKENFTHFIKNKLLLGITSVFLIVLISGIFSENTSFWWERVRIKLPFLVLPFAFFSYRSVNFKNYCALLYAFLMMVFIIALCVFVNYLFHQQEITSSYSYANVMPAPINHIRFSLMLVFSFWICVYFLKKHFVLKFSVEKYFIALIGVFLFVFIHVYAVRSGLLAFYLSILFFGMYLLIKEKKRFVGWIVLLSVLIFPIISYYFSDTFKTKINYSLYDIQMFLDKNDIGNLSDGNRLLSIILAWDVFKKNDYMAIGYGDVKQEMIIAYNQFNPSIEKKLDPHNQLIYLLLGSGIGGLIWFLVVSLYPLFLKKYNNDWLFVIFHIILFSSYLTEATIETQLGTALYILFLLLGINHLDNNNVTEKI